MSGGGLVVDSNLWKLIGGPFVEATLAFCGAEPSRTLISGHVHLINVLLYFDRRHVESRRTLSLHQLQASEPCLLKGFELVHVPFPLYIYIYYIGTFFTSLLGFMCTQKLAMLGNIGSALLFAGPNCH